MRAAYAASAFHVNVDELICVRAVRLRVHVPAQLGCRAEAERAPVRVGCDGRVRAPEAAELAGYAAALMSSELAIDVHVLAVPAAPAASAA